MAGVPLVRGLTAPPAQRKLLRCQQSMRRVLLAVTLLGAMPLHRLCAQPDSGRERTLSFSDHCQTEARRLGMPSLAHHGVQSAELRLWYGGLFGLGVIRLRQIHQRWYACRYPAGGELVYTSILRDLPFDSGAATWKAAIDSGLFLLPQFPDRPRGRRGIEGDGTSYVIESFDGNRYRVATASNPEVHQSPDDQRFLRVLGVLDSLWRHAILPRCMRWSRP